MTSEAQKRAIKKYQSDLTRVVIWCTPDEKEEIKRRAAQAGQSVNEYCKDKILGGG